MYGFTGKEIYTQKGTTQLCMCMYVAIMYELYQYVILHIITQHEKPKLIAMCTKYTYVYSSVSMFLIDL